MGIQRIRAVQGHPVPTVIGGSNGFPFEDQVLRGPEKMEEQGDPFEAPMGATVLNGMQGVPLFTCNACHEVVAESEFDAHQC